MMKLNNIEIKRLELGPWSTNAYVIICLKTGDSVLIDAPSDANIIMKSLQGTSPKYILLTHTHIDHIDALSELRPKLKAPLATHAADSTRLQTPPDILLNDGDVVSFGKVKLEVLHTPGHTPGSLCFKIDKCLLSGDTIFPGGPGRTGSPADLRQIIKSITDKILVLPDDTEILPGHGDFTTVKKERDEFSIFSARPHDPNLCGHVLWCSPKFDMLSRF
jgi:glyoxylase-like metal-dependent hydrolase (beta-lactamase superfamily II)